MTKECSALNRIYRLLKPPPYGRTWCERPCCCPGECTGCLAKETFEIAAEAIGLVAKGDE